MTDAATEDDLGTGVADPMADTAPAAQPPADPGTAPTWYDGISDKSLREHAARFQTAGDVVKAHLDLRRKLSTAINMPGPDADESTLAEFRKRIGVPEKVDDYTYTRPDGLPAELQPDDAGVELERGFVAEMHKHHASQEAVQAAINWYYSTLQSSIRQQQEADAEYAQQAETTLRTELGRDFERQRKAADTFIAQMWSPEAVNELRQLETKDGRFVLDNPTFIRGLMKAGLAMSEEAHVGVQTLPAERQATLQHRIAELQGSPDYWNNAQKQSEVRDLYTQLYGDESIRGTSGFRR